MASAGSPLDVSALLGLLSSQELTTAGGSAAAVVGAVAAAVAAKAARFAEDPGLLAQAEALGARLASLAADDASAYGEALRALAAAGGGGSPGRDFQLGRIVARAAAAPVAIAEAAADVAVLARDLADRGDSSLRADAVAAGMLAAGAARAAAHLVEVNLTLLPEDEQLIRARGAASAAAEAAGS